MFAAILLMAAAPPAAGPTPLALHPENPHYFLFRGKPTVLMGSTEHYGAVLNLDFDAAPYLDELQRRGLNLTRVFSGTYREVPGAFNIKDNTLAPETRPVRLPLGDVLRPGAGGEGRGIPTRSLERHLLRSPQVVRRRGWQARGRRRIHAVLPAV